METVKMDYTENPVYIANKELFDNEISVTDHDTKVEKVEVRYEDYIIDGVMRDNYKQSLSSKDDTDNRNRDNHKPRNDSNEDEKFSQDDKRDNNNQRNHNRHKRSANTVHGNSQIPPGF